MSEQKGREIARDNDLILNEELNMVIDWSSVDKEDYLLAMERSRLKILK